MTDHVYVNADKTAVVDRLSTSAKLWKMPVADAIKLGLLAKDYAPQQRRIAPAHVDKVGPTAPKRRYTRKKK